MLYPCGYCMYVEKGVFYSAPDEAVFDSLEALYEHIEMSHDLPILREGEDRETAIARVKAKQERTWGYAVIDGPKCRCPKCKAERAEKQAKEAEECQTEDAEKE